MKKKILLFLVLFSTSLIFAQNSEYTRLYEEGQNYEAEENWFHAAISYMNAVNADPVHSEEAYTRLNMILDAFKQGKPGFSEYDEFSYRDLWIDIFKTAEKYFVETPPFRVVIFPLQKGELNYKDKTATFNFKILMSKSNAYSVVADAISTGSKYAIKPDWGFSQYFDWPAESVTGAEKFDVEDSRCYYIAPKNKSPKEFLIDNIPTNPIYAYKDWNSLGNPNMADDYSEFNYFGSLSNSMFSQGYYTLELSLKNENGENILSHNIKVRMDGTTKEIPIEGISHEYFKDIEKGKIKPKIEKITLKYGYIIYYRNKSESDFMDINPKNMEVIYSGLPTTIKDSPIFMFNEYLYKLAKKGKELEQQIVKNPILPETIINLTIGEKPVLTYPDIGEEPKMEAAPKDLLPWEKKKNKKLREENYQKALENYNMKLEEAKEKAEQEYNTKLAEYEKALQILEEKKASDPRLKYNWYYVLIPDDMDYLPMENGNEQHLVNSDHYIENFSAAVLNHKLITDINNEIYIYNGDKYYNSDMLTIILPYEESFDLYYTGIPKQLPTVGIYPKGKVRNFSSINNYNSIAYRNASWPEIEKLKIPLDYPRDYDGLVPVNSEGKFCSVLIISEPIVEKQ